MDNYLMDLWQKTLRLVRNEITDVSFDTGSRQLNRFQ